MEYALTLEMSPVTYNTLSLSTDPPLHFMWTSHICTDKSIWPVVLLCSLAVIASPPIHHCHPLPCHPSPCPFLILSSHQASYSSSVLNTLGLPTTLTSTTTHTVPCHLVPLLSAVLFPFIFFFFSLKMFFHLFLFHIANSPCQTPSMYWPCTYSCAP